MRKFLQVFIAVCIISTSLQLNTASAQKPMHELHSMLIFNFIKYVEWPADAKTGDFIISVYGDDDVFKQLNILYSGRTVKGQNVKVMKANGLADMKNANLIYLADNKSGDFEEVLSEITGKPTLLITDKNGLGEKGSNINFKVVGGKLKFELNETAFNKNNLKVSSSLVSMAIVI